MFKRILSILSLLMVLVFFTSCPAATDGAPGNDDESVTNGESATNGESTTDTKAYVGTWGNGSTIFELNEDGTGIWEDIEFTYSVDATAGTITFTDTSSDGSGFIFDNEKDGMYGYAVADGALALQYDSEITYYSKYSSVEDITGIYTGVFEAGTGDDTEELTLNDDNTFTWLGYGDKCFDLGSAESSITGTWSEVASSDDSGYSLWDVTFVVSSASSTPQGATSSSSFTADTPFTLTFDVFSDTVMSYEGLYNGSVKKGTFGNIALADSFTDVTITDVVPPKAAELDDLIGLWSVKDSNVQVYIYEDDDDTENKLTYTVETDDGFFAQATLYIRTDDISVDSLTGSIYYKPDGVNYFLGEDGYANYSRQKFSDWYGDRTATIDGDTLTLFSEDVTWEEGDQSFTKILTREAETPLVDLDDLYFSKSLIGTWTSDNNTFTFNEDGTYSATWNDESFTGLIDMYGIDSMHLTEINKNIDITYDESDANKMTLRISYENYEFTKQ